MNLSTKEILIIVLTVIIIVLIMLFTVKIYYNDNSKENINVNDLIDEDLPAVPTSEAKINTTGVNSQLIGSDEKGTVEILGPFGNVDSDVKIAYLTGMHPYESKAHKALFDVIKAKSSSLNYCYYVYRTNVTLDYDDDEGRMKGQLLAQKYVAPDVISKKYDFVVDIHSNKGMNGGNYEETNFIFAPGNDEKSVRISNILISEIDDVCSYVPVSQTSPPFVTIPIEESGIPTIIYETWSYEEYEYTVKLIWSLVDSVDSLSFNN